MSAPPGYVDIDALLEEYIKAGIDADILPGAHTRAARMYKNTGYRRGPQGLDRHHTAQHINTPEINSINYMTFWAKYPVMCNTYPWKDGRLTICAAGPSYTAGSGGPLGDITSGNAEYWSMEIGNNGVGEWYSAAQQETILRATAVEVEFFGKRHGWADDFSKIRIPAHFEWTSRKIDPSGPSHWTGGKNAKWDMNQFRNDVKKKHAEIYKEAHVPTPPSGLTFYPINSYPQASRSSDTRKWPGHKAAGGKVYRFSLGDHVPKDAKAAMVTITAHQPEGNGWVAAGYPGSDVDQTSSVNYFGPSKDFPNGLTIANSTVVWLKEGQFDLKTLRNAHIIVDVIGYYK